MKDYRYMNGIVGHYGHYNVQTIVEKDFNINQSKEDKQTIFALIDLDNDKLKLIHSGMWIGNMSSQGKMDLFDRSMFYGESIEEALPAITVEVKGGKENMPEILVEVTSASGKTIDDYKAGETLADRFTRGFSKW